MARVRRELAINLLALAERIVSSDTAHWVKAMSAELSEIQSDSEALKFALGCVWAAAVFQDELPIERPRLPIVELACGLMSVAVGLIYLHNSGAPFSFSVNNVCATAIGIGCFFGATNRSIPPLAWIALTLIVLATTVFGVTSAGASRWLRIGSIALQPTLMFVPAMLISFAQTRNAISALCLVVISLTSALQPDRAMATVLAAGTIAIALKNREHLPVVAALSALASLGVTLYRADLLPAASHVDGVLIHSFEIGTITGCAVVFGTALLFLPALLSRQMLFALVWLVIVAAAASGNYPAPLVGYGGSAIVGYFFSLAFLPERRNHNEARHKSTSFAPFHPDRIGRFRVFCVEAFYQANRRATGRFRARSCPQL
jgi:hypothetical protein